MIIDNIQKTQTQKLWQSGIELAKRKPDISGFMQSYPDKVVWNLYAIDQANHSKNGFGEKQTPFFRQVHKMSCIQTEISCLFAAVPLAFFIENTNV